MKRMMLVVAVAAVFLQAEAAYRRGALVEEFRFRPSDKAACAGANTVGDVAWVAGGGKAGDGALRLRSPKKTTSATFAIGLDATKFAGKVMQLEADVKGLAVGHGEHRWNGPKFMFPHRSGKGQKFPEAPKEFGTYDWKTSTMVFAFPKDTQDLRLVVGLEAAPGELWVDAVRLYEAEEIDDADVVAPPNEKAAKIPRGPWRGRHNPAALRGVMSGGDLSEAAFETLASWKVNLIRLQIGIATKNQKTLDDWFRALDAKLDWAETILLRCRRHGMKAVIDLHGGPGTVATKHASFIIPPDYDPEPLKETWRRIARRLRDYPEVYGYDILNEPLATPARWDDLFLAVTAEIRRLDRKTPVITEFCHRYFEGENVIYSPHFYSPHAYTHAGVVNSGGVRWSYPGYIDGIYWDVDQLRVDLEPWIRFSLAHPDARVLVGEFSAVVWAKGAANYIRDCISVFEEYGWDWTYHAFREWPPWDVEYTHVGDYELQKWQKATVDTARKVELLKGLANNVASSPFKVLPAEIVRRHFDRFSFDDEETVRTAISNQGSGWWANAAIPRFDCPDADVVRTYYFRWWTYRKHLRRAKDGRWVVTEFLPDVGWAGAENTISCPLNHHLAEGRWLRRPEYLDGYLPFMMERGSMSGPRAYAAAPAWGALERVRVTGDWTQAKALLAAFARNYAAWEAGWDRKSLSLADPGVSCVRPIRGVPFRVGYRAERGLFDCPGDREGAEFALSADGARPLVNALMWAEASAIAEIARAAGDAATAESFAAKAASLERNVKARLWNPGRAFFTALAADGAQDGVCELTGYAPFAVGMPLAGFGAAWRGIVDERGFLAPKGLVFPRRDTPGFAPGAVDAARHECLWNGPSWPYATSVALAGLARALHGGLEMPVGREDFARLMALYARQHVRVREDGRAVPWIDENLSGFTGEWLARDILLAQAKAEGRKPAYHERGKDYNHSTFCDLVITGLCGLVPQADGALRVDPLAPAAWGWWCLDGVRYHGRDVTVLFDRDGTRYGRGQGLVILDP